MPKHTQISLFDFDAPTPAPDPEITFSSEKEPELVPEVGKPEATVPVDVLPVEAPAAPERTHVVEEPTPHKIKIDIPERAPMPPKVILVEVPDVTPEAPVVEPVVEAADTEAFAEDEPIIFEEQEVITEPNSVTTSSAQTSILPTTPKSARIRVSRDPSVKKSPRGRKPLNPEGPVEPIEVPDDETLFQKMYYPIGQVAEMFKVNPSLIRLWENEFDILKPRKNGKGDRLFRPEDVKNLKLIHHLIREKKYTMEGAKAFLKRNKQAEERFALIESLKKLQGFLRELKAGM